MPQIRRARRATVTTAAVLTGCALTLTACSGGGSSGSAGDRLRVSMAFPPAQAMSPYGDDAVALSRLSVIEGLTKLDASGVPKPALATSWKSSDGDRTWTFQLRKARFQDGRKLTADAVVRSIEEATEASPQPRVLSDAGKLTVKAEGPRTVAVTSSEPDALLPQRLANPSLAVLSPKAYGKGEGKDTKVTVAGHATGPFTLTKVNGTVSATLERNDDYWGGRAKASGVDVKFSANGTTRANALRSGSTDIAEYVPVSQASVLKKEQVREVPTARTNSLYMNTEHGPFRDARLRAAARAAIDSPALIKSVYEGYADKPQGLLGPGVKWAAGKRVPVRDRAKPASEAQVKKAPTITLATYTNRPELPEVVTALQQQFEKAGFKVKQVVRDYARMEADALAGKYDIFVQARNTLLDTGDPVSYLESDFTCKGSFNMSQLCDKDVDEAVGKAAATEDTAARQRAEMKAEAEILRTDAVVPLLHERFIQGVADGVEGVSLDPMERTLVTADTHRE
ncbi:ABC transporter substrate-binding protein [Streptomyces albus]|uniref:ABC transporter substrate-binding protein n=1 Tax=Streptomyces albus TaxID=1888 RepID=A0A8H1LK13_9ACTN|nr:ABC transporter substrate-binding protein [Streptomyces albus]TGG88081.1 ABC transporter substrate-binding protein [Streptomyces albus]UVN56102.1 ABC transporter substrate-binding protein [Streptomyces albus]